MDVCKGCAFEFGWTQQSTSVPNKCKGCQMVDGKPSNYKPKPQTNAERIRAMSDEELAEDYCKTLLKVMQYFGIKNTGMLEDAVRVRLEWLKQPAEDE